MCVHYLGFKHVKTENKALNGPVKPLISSHFIRLLSHFISLHLTFILHHLTFLSHFLSHFISFLTMKPSTSSQTTQTTHIFQRFFHMNHLNLQSLHLRLPTKKSPTAGRSATRASLLESLGSWAFFYVVLLMFIPCLEKDDHNKQKNSRVEIMRDQLDG